MKTEKEYVDDQGFSLLLVGHPMSGKTNVAMCFPDPWFNDADEKLANAVRRVSLDKTFYWDDPNLGPDGNELPQHLKWDRTVALTKAALIDPKPKTIVQDSLSQLARFLQSHLVARGAAGKDLIIGGEKVMTQSHWYPFGVVMEQFIVMNKAIKKKNFIMTAHIDIEKDDISGTLMERPLVGGGLKNNIGKLFTDVWLCKATPVIPSPDYPKGVRYSVQTVPTPRMSLGTSLDLPPEFEFTWETLAKKLKGATL